MRCFCRRETDPHIILFFLHRGETLDNLQGKSELLLRDSARYRKTARDVNLQALYRKYGPPAIAGLVFLLVIYWRFWWY